MIIKRAKNHKDKCTINVNVPQDKDFILCGRYILNMERQRKQLKRKRL